MKILRKSILLTLVLITSTICLIPISAKPAPIYSASGTLDSYHDYPSAQILSGEWSVTVTKNNVWFEASYLELNIDENIENSPEGSIDKFELKLGKTDFWEIDGDSLFFLGYIRYQKEWQTMDGKPKNVVWWAGKGVFIDSSGIRIANEPALTSGDILGTTLIFEQE